MSYRNLEVWKQAKELTILIHQMTMKLPKFEQYEVGNQIRRSIKSVKANIVEGYGRRYYKNEFIRFIIFAIASADETADHLDTLYETGSFVDHGMYRRMKVKIEMLGKMLVNFLQAVQTRHMKFD